ncbi:MAG: hypothetical protein GX262_00665 [Clostridia bacterium]|nr:hypothetical protein [Clostridia bacterium]
MLIQTYERAYKIISHVLTNELGDIYLCRDVASDLEYTVLRIKDRVIIPRLMVSLDTSIQKETFTDYIEHFVFEDDLYIVLKYYRGVSLSEKLRSDYHSLGERMKIGKGILERIVFLGMPLYFLKNCLHGERIIVRPNLDVFFNYVPSDINELAVVDDRAVLKGFATIFKMLFHKELSMQSAPPINEFNSALRNEQHFDSIEIYKQYNKMCREVALIPEEELKKPKSKLFLFWEKVKRQFKVLKKILAVGLMIVGIIYLAYTAKEAINPTINKVNHFEFIGTLEIEQVQ